MTGIAPIRRMRLCRQCPRVFESPHAPGWPPAFCSPECHQASKPLKPAKPRARLRADREPAKRRPISPASPGQRAKKAAGASIVSAATKGLDPAHLCPRGLGGCDHEDCIVPLTRAEHERFDRGELDLLPHLVPHHVAELQHAIGHYRGDLIALLERLTGCSVELHERRAA